MSESRITAIEPPATFRNFAAPRSHGAVLVDPPLAQAGRLIAENRSLAAGWNVEVGGTPLAALRLIARQEILEAAQRYVHVYRDSRWSNVDVSDLSERPVVMGGHQPTLFHPGVWFKNFALSRIATEHDAVAVNLVVDNDLSGAAAIRCPSYHGGEKIPVMNGPAARLVSKSVPYDGPLGLAVPHEQRWISDWHTFDSFPDRLRSELAGIVDQPLVSRFWPHAKAASQRCANLGCSLAIGRHALEAELGLETLELPISSGCKTVGFASFIMGILNELPRFQDCYNVSLFEYRTAHGIRSSAHPVPALDELDGWLEAPLWIYGDDDGRRRGAWVRQVGDWLEISDRAGRVLRIDRPESQAGVGQLLEAMGPQFKLRPRALVTTMFARLLLSDLFLHGIGGAKYDQLGDRIIEKFFGIRAPQYCVISATVLLPGWEQALELMASEPSFSQLTRSLRDIRFSPELFEGRANLPPALTKRKRALLASIPPRGEKRAWHQEMKEVNWQLASHLTQTEQELRDDLKHAAEREREMQIWTSREHAFPLFPLDYLQRSLGV